MLTTVSYAYHNAYNARKVTSELKFAFFNKTPKRNRKEIFGL